MDDVPVGFVVGTLIMAFFVWSGLRPRDTHGPRPTPSYVLGTVSSELYGLMLLLVVAPVVLAVTEGDLQGPVGAAALILPALSLVGVVAALRLALRSTEVLDSALQQGLGTAARVQWSDGPGQALRVLLAPLPWPRQDVRRLKNLRYGEASGTAHLLDLYVPRTQLCAGPVLVYFHGGGFFSGAKSREARLLLERLAGRGWVCVSANYRLRPVEFPGQVVDAKRVMAWVHTHGATYGADPSRTFVAGGSAGAHIAMTCAFTENEDGFQPGFEQVDTRVAGAVGFYGYYGPVAGGPLPSSPADYLHADLPPVMLVHGARDPMSPVSEARAFAEKLRRTSASPAVWAELPGALHAFDRFASIRSAAVAAAVEVFADAVLERHSTATG